MRGIQLANTRCWLIYSNWKKTKIFIPTTRVDNTNGLFEKTSGGAVKQKEL